MKWERQTHSYFEAAHSIESRERRKIRSFVISGYLLFVFSHLQWLVIMFFQWSWNLFDDFFSLYFVFKWRNNDFCFVFEREKKFLLNKSIDPRENKKLCPRRTLLHNVQCTHTHLRQIYVQRSSRILDHCKIYRTISSESVQKMDDERNKLTNDIANLANTPFWKYITSGVWITESHICQCKTCYRRYMWLSMIDRMLFVNRFHLCFTDDTWRWEKPLHLNWIVLTNAMWNFIVNRESFEFDFIRI